MKFSINQSETIPSNIPRNIAQQYKEAAADEERNKEASEWDVCIGDGLDETNEY